MPGFQAIILVCLVSIPSDSCNEQTAVGVMSELVPNELQCTMGWQDVIARSAQAPDVGEKTYVRTLCRKVAPGE